MCHLDGLNARRLSLHGSDVLGQVSIRTESDDGGHALGDAVSFDDVHFLLGEAGDLARREDHVAVVGQ